MMISIKTTTRCIAFTCMLAFIGTTALSAASSNPGTDALTILTRSTRFIESSPAFLVTGDAGGEQMLKNGQLVEYGMNFTAVFVRPSKLLLQQSARDGTRTTLIFDGETITVASDVDGRHIYDTTPQSGNVNESLDYVTNRQGVAREMSDFLTEQLTQSLDIVQSALSLGKSSIDGVMCDHLVLRSDDRDGQIWIARGDEPLPRRILITHRNRPSQPRFWIQFNEWDLSPELSESTFSYSPPDGAVKVHYFQD